jgi:hypothetical protein
VTSRSKPTPTTPAPFLAKLVHAGRVLIGLQAECNGSINPGAPLWPASMILIDALRPPKTAGLGPWRPLAAQ